MRRNRRCYLLCSRVQNSALKSPVNKQRVQRKQYPYIQVNIEPVIYTHIAQPETVTRVYPVAETVKPYHAVKEIGQLEPPVLRDQYYFCGNCNRCNSMQHRHKAMNKIYNRCHSKGF